MTNSNKKQRVREYQRAYRVNYTTALRAVASVRNNARLPVAYVRETYPIPGPRTGLWDGNHIQVVVACPFCGEQHLHGGWIDDGRAHGHRVPHSTQRPRMGCVIHDARPRRTVSRHTPSGWHYTYEGPWPGDPEPTVDEVNRLGADSSDRQPLANYLHAVSDWCSWNPCLRHGAVAYPYGLRSFLPSQP